MPLPGPLTTRDLLEGAVAAEQAEHTGYPEPFPGDSKDIANDALYSTGGPLARVPSIPTILPGPVTAINLEDLAEAILPGYTVNELKQALLRANTAKVKDVKSSPTDAPPVEDVSPGEVHDNTLDESLGGELPPHPALDIESGLDGRADDEDNQENPGAMRVYVDSENGTLHISSGILEDSSLEPTPEEEVADEKFDLEYGVFGPSADAPLDADDPKRHRFSAVAVTVDSESDTDSDEEGMDGFLTPRTHVAPGSGRTTPGGALSPNGYGSISAWATPNGEETPNPTWSSVSDAGSENADYETISEAIPIAIGNLAASLTAVPGSRVDQIGLNMDSGVSSTPREDTGLLDGIAEDSQNLFGVSQVPGSELAVAQRADANVVMSLPPSTVEAMSSTEAENKGFVVPIPQKKNAPGELTPLLIMQDTMRDEESTERKHDETEKKPLRLVEVDSKVTSASGPSGDHALRFWVQYKVNMLGYAILLIAIIAVGSQGSVVKSLSSVKGTVTASWLMQCQGLLVLPLCVFQLYSMSPSKRAALFADTSIPPLVLAVSVAQVAWALGFFVAVDFTSLFRAWQLNNIHSVIIVGIALCAKQNVSRGEITGASAALIGIIIMEIPSFFGRNLSPLFGDFVAILSSFGAIVFLDRCSKLGERMPLFVMMVPLSFLNAFFFSLIGCLLQGADYSMTDNGAFGWMTSARIIHGMYLGGVVGILGTVSCIAALNHLPSVVVGVAQTLMPPFGTGLAVLLGLDAPPALCTSIGGLILVYGVLSIAQATSTRKVVVEINQPAGTQ